jgi:predicted DNA-binding transcriptional regulator YafY
MNRRSFLRAAGATGLLLIMHGPAAGSIFGSKVSMETQIRQALAERRLVKFKYHGHTRLVEPHALGRVNEGRLALLGWQVSGDSASEPPPGWRTFVLAEIRSLKLLRKNYVPRPDYDAVASKLKSIEAEVVGGPRPTTN